MVIWKEIIRLEGRQTTPMPIGAKILTAQVQKNHICIWFLCAQTAFFEGRKFLVYGTGIPMPDNPGEYLGTFQLDEGNLVLHVFEEK